jgi:tetratricopeptide (TPR) repeat protein
VPHNVLGTSLLATVTLLRGQAALALPMFDEVNARHPGLSIGAAGRAQTLAALGRPGEARAALQALLRDWRGGYLSPYQLAMVHERLGERAEALAALARAIDERDPNAICLPVDPTFDALRADAAGAALVSRVLGAPLTLPAAGAAGTA